MQQNTEKSTDKRLANLKPAWGKGVSGNPNGRPPKEFSFTSAMKEFLDEEDKEKKKLRKEMLIEQTFKQAMRGDSTLIKMMWNYFDGMPQGSSPQVAVQVNNFPVPTKEIIFRDMPGLLEKVGISKEEMINYLQGLQNEK